MSTELGILLDLLLVIALAKVLEEAAAHLGQPPIIGDLLAGIIIGPTVLGLIRETHNVEVIGWLGVVVLIFLAGLETDIEMVKKYEARSIAVALGGVAATFVLAFAIASAFGYGLLTALFIATILTPTSVSVTSMTLLELGKIRTEVGEVILSAAFADDVMAMVLFALASSLAYHGVLRYESVARILVALIIVLAIFYVLYRTSNRLLDGLRARSRLLDTPITQLLILGIAMAALSSHLGLSPLIGAYLSGLALSGAVKSDRTYRFLERLVQIISPFFFVYAGILLDPGVVAGRVNLTEAVWIVLAMVLAGVVGKVLGCGLTARASGMSSRDSLAVGVGMMPRAGVDLVIAVVGLTLGILTMELYLSALVLIYVTSVVSPFLVKKLM